MNLKNCKSCGKIFNYVAGRPICPACKESEEKKFQEVKEFCRENKQATINEIVENCDVAHTQVRQWIREEKLLFSEDSPIGIDCEGCGVMIKTGRYCEKCKNNLMRGFDDLKKKNEPPKDDDDGDKKGKKDSNRMRFLG